MFQIYPSVPERRAGCPPAAGRKRAEQIGTGASKAIRVEAWRVLQAVMERGYGAIIRFGRSAQDRSGFYPLLLFLAEAAAAARGYLIWPSVARSDDRIGTDDGFIPLDR
jgi:hypothetical protein